MDSTLFAMIEPEKQMLTKCSEQEEIGRYLSRRLLPLSLGIGLLIVFLAPLTYWNIAQHDLQQDTNRYAGELADRFRELALESPDLWRYQTHKLTEIAARFHTTLDIVGFSFLDAQGKPTNGPQYLQGRKFHGRKLTLAEEFHFTLGTAPIIFNSRQVGTVAVIVSDARLLRKTFILFAVSLLVGTGLALLVYQFPVRTVRRAEKIGRHATEFARTVMESINDSVSIIDVSSYRVVGANAEFLKNVGMSAAEVLGRSCYDLNHGLSKPCCQPHENCPLMETVKSGMHATAEHIKLHANGKKIYVEESTSPVFDDNGRVAQVVHVARDISERKRTEEALKESEAKFRSLVEDSLVGVYIIQDQLFRYVNPKLAAIFGYETEELLDKGPAELVFPDDWPLVSENLRKRLTGEITSRNYAFRGITKEKKVIHVDVFGSRTVYHGAPAVIGTLLDITDRKASEEALAAQTLELARSNAELEQFAYVASHDLQEPLRMVSSYMQLLSRRYSGKLDGDADEFITFAVDGANRMQRLINDLLMFSRLGTRGKKPQPVDCEAVLGYALDNLRQSIADKGADISHDMLPTVMGDEVQLTQLFQNLIANAIKFSRDEALQVHVAAEPLGSEWLFSVRDNGIGIAPEYYERVFQIFQRLHSRTDYPGTGIGLAICRKIVERHGGRIWLDSEPGRGTTFYFLIPQAEVK